MLERRGHTEATVDLAKLCHSIPAGVICEIMGDDGQMLRFEELTKFAAHHGLKMISIEALVVYRNQLSTNENKISI